MIDKNNGKGFWLIRQFRDGKLIAEVPFENLTTYVGQNYMLATAFTGTSAITSWFAGLVDQASFTGGNINDTTSSHSGWIEFLGYAETTRQTWGAGTPTTGSITNASPMVFTINAAGTLAGLFISSSNVKGGTTGTLWNVGTIATGPMTVNIGDVIQATYVYSLT